MAKSCDNCLHRNINGADEPCSDCEYKNKWEPKGAEVEKRCGNCEDGIHSICIEPCLSCDNKTYSNWTLKQTNIKETNTNSIKEEAMKTQEIFAVVVTENEKVKDENGNIESVKKRVIYSAIDIPAFDENNAKAKALIAANKVAGVKGIKDLDEVEVIVRPFQAS